MNALSEKSILMNRLTCYYLPRLHKLHMYYRLRQLDYKFYLGNSVASMSGLMAAAFISRFGMLVRVGKIGYLGPWSKVIVYCYKLSFCKNDSPIRKLATIHYDSSPRPQRSCFAHPNARSKEIVNDRLEIIFFYFSIFNFSTRIWSDLAKLTMI